MVSETLPVILRSFIHFNVGDLIPVKLGSTICLLSEPGKAKEAAARVVETERGPERSIILAQIIFTSETPAHQSRSGC